jgi:methylated-DNA-[protein]-cysteine S-methyltransferase
MKLRTSTFESPIGTMHVALVDDAVCALGFASQWAALTRRLTLRFGDIEMHEEQNAGGIATRLQEFCCGDLRAFDGIRVDAGGTDFQKRVWCALVHIAPGTVMSYGEIASRIDMPRASRAVGAANGANPVSLIVPCHRVVGRNGKLSGYAGGVDRKRWLLNHEGAWRDDKRTHRIDKHDAFGTGDQLLVRYAPIASVSG